MTTIKEINQIAQKVKNNVEKKQKLPKIDGYDYGEYGYLLAKSVISPNKDITKIKVKPAPSPTGSSISRSIDKADYIKLAKNFVNFIEKNKQVPNFSYFGSYKIRPKLIIYAFAKIIVFYKENKALPKYCNFNSKVFSSTTKIVSNDEVFNYFVKIFGNVKTIDEAFNKVKDKGYAYYYDDIYSNKSSIDRIKAYRGVNCTDSCQVFWHIAKALGYDVRCIHVQCQSGGHVRLQVKHPINTKGKWINRDPAAILSANGKPLTYIWCENGAQLAINPKWFLDNVNR